MLARASSDAGTRVRRSKSASTIHRQRPTLEPLDPDVAQHHALAAATTAYARACENTAVSRIKRSSELSRTKSTSSRKSLTSQGRHFPPRDSRTQSVCGSRGGQPSGGQAQSGAPTMMTEKFPSFYPTPGSDRPLSAQASITPNENLRPASQPRSHRQSASSSVTSQQIRKARSMYYASSIQTGSPIARPPVKYLTTPPPLSVNSGPEPSPGLRHVRNKALSPLASPQLPVTVQPGETIDNARDKYLQGFQQRQIRNRPSLFFAPFKKRQDRAKKRDRPMSAGIMSISSGSRPTQTEGHIESLDDFGMPKHKKEKRSFSNSIKDKFKKVFRRSSNNAAILPVQQVEASRDYFSTLPHSTEHPRSIDRGSEIPSPDDETLLRARSRTETLERIPSPLARPISRGSNKSRGSNRSLHSETNATHSSSRVTSWSDSSVGGTLTQRDIKRLTVIHEAKDSIGSEAERNNYLWSVKRKSVASLPGLAAFQDSTLLPMGELIEESPTSIDPKRVFSALMKEMNRPKSSQIQASMPNSSSGTGSDVFESSATKDLHSTVSREPQSAAGQNTSIFSDSRPPSRLRPSTAHSKASSIRSFGKALKSTIRAVTPTEHKPAPGPNMTISVQDPMSIPITDTASSSESSVPISLDGNGDENTICSIETKMNTCPGHQYTLSSQASHPGTPTPEQIQQRVEKVRNRWKDPLLEHSMPSILPQTDQGNAAVGFYDRASTQKLHAVIGPPAPVVLEGDSLKKTPPKAKLAASTPASPKSPRSRPLFSPLSPSIYSRNTDGISILPNDSVMSFDAAQDKSFSQGEGSAIIMTSQSIKSYVIGTPSPQRQTDSLRSSRDWKEWLSHEVSELGAISPDHITFHEQYTPTIRQPSPMTRHQREFTQIEDDDTTTVILRDSMDTTTPRRELLHGQMQMNSSTNDRDVQLRDAQESCSHQLGPRESSGDSSTSQNTSPPANLALSHTSSTSNSPSYTPNSSRMNDRFPFINTGRRSSSHSARQHHLSRTSMDNSSGSSSLKSKATPSPKVYSDFSITPSNRTTRYEPITGPRWRRETVKHQDKQKENATPPPTGLKRSENLHSVSEMSPQKAIARPRSMLPLSSALLNRSSATVTQYTTTAEDIELTKVARPSDPVASPKRLRPRLQAHRISPGKLAARPRSAFDLRNADTSSCSKALYSPSSSPNRFVLRDRAYWQAELSATQHKSATSDLRALDQDTHWMVLEQPGGLSGCPSPCRSSIDLNESSRAAPQLHMKHSSSTLALNKEPSPGNESRNIDAIIEEPGTGITSNRSLTPSIRSSIVIEGSGRTTPGQRMAERFLKDRTVLRSNEAGSPDEVSVSGRLKREDTPAFL